MSQAVTTIAPHTFIKGELRCDGITQIAGRIEGNITAHDALELAPEAVVTGDLRGTDVAIHGTLKGNITAHSCRLGPTARVAGSLCTANLAIAEGARFIGQVCVGEVAAPTPPAEARLQDAAVEIDALGALEATLERVEQAATGIHEIATPTPDISTTSTIHVVPENIQAVLHRAPRIIRAR